MRRTIAVLALTAGVFAGVRQDAAAAAKYVIKVATLAPDGSAWMVKFDDIKKQVLEATGGQVQFKTYPGGVLGDEREILFKMRVGQVDGGGFMGFGTAQVCPEAGVLMMPMVFRDYAELDAVMERLWPYLNDRCEANGYVALGWSEIGFSYMFSAKPIRTMEDFRRAKPWAGPGDPVLTEMFRAANVSTMVVPVSDVLTALQTGLIQTVYSPPLACVAIQWFTKVKYRIDLRLMYSLGGVFVTKSSWERIPTDLRATTLELCRRGVRDLSAGVRKSNDDSLKVMADNGIATVVPPPEAVADFEGVSRRAAAALRGPDYPVEAETLLNRYLAEYRGKGGTKPDAP